MKKYLTKFLKSLITLDGDQLNLVITVFEYTISKHISGNYTQDQFNVLCDYEAIPQINGTETYEFMYVVIQNGTEYRGFKYDFQLGLIDVMTVETNR